MTFRQKLQGRVNIYSSQKRFSGRRARLLSSEGFFVLISARSHDVVRQISNQKDIFCVIFFSLVEANIELWLRFRRKYLSAALKKRAMNSLSTLCRPSLSSNKSPFLFQQTRQHAEGRGQKIGMHTRSGGEQGKNLGC